MVGYTDFINLGNAVDAEISRFQEKTGHLGFDVFNWRECFDIEPTRIVNRDMWVFEALTPRLMEYPSLMISSLGTARDNIQPYREETPDNIRREATVLRESLITYRLISEYRRSNNAIKFLEESFERKLTQNEKKTAKSGAESLVGALEPMVIKSFNSALAVVQVTLKQGKDGYLFDYIGSCPIADFWCQGIKDVVYWKRIPKICDHCGNFFTTYRPEALSCQNCTGAAKQRRRRAKNKKDSSQEG